MSALLLEADGVAKSFAGVQALRDGRLSLRPGAVHALCGGNGAGKSTFLNIVMGLLRRDAGQIKVRGRSVNFVNPAQALAAGIAIITQELSPIPDMTVAENLFLGREPKRLGCFVDAGRLNRMAAGLLDQLRFRIDPRQKMRALSLAQTQRSRSPRRSVTRARSWSWTSRPRPSARRKPRCCAMPSAP